MRKKLIFILIFFIVLILPNFLKKKTQQHSPTVPREYRLLYQKLEEDLQRFEKEINQLSSSSSTPPIYGAELLTANANRGDDLLKENSWQGNLLYLDSLQRLGVEGVTVAIGYPILLESFPRHKEYLDFYRKLASEIRRRNLKLMVKMGLIFPQKEFSRIGVDYSKLTLAEYFAGKKKMAALIVNQIRPDYLSLGSEPQTEGLILGKKITSDRFADYVRETITTITKKGAILGAGIGSWEEIDFVRQYIKIPGLDFVDIHIYPLNSRYEDYLKKTLTIIDLARLGRKNTVFSEFWLYKADHQDLLKGAINPNIFKRDVFEFWSPLDSKMLVVIEELSRKKGVIFISPFWSRYFFAYLDYNFFNKIKPAISLFGEVDKKAVRNMILKKFTNTGLAYQRLINRK